MKKFIFSAVALTAFSFSAMANNEVKEVEQVKEDQVLKTNGFDCDDLANMIVEYMEQVEGVDDCEYLDHTRDVIYNNCVNSSGGN